MNLKSHLKKKHDSSDGKNKFTNTFTFHAFLWFSHPGFGGSIVPQCVEYQVGCLSWSLFCIPAPPVVWLRHGVPMDQHCFSCFGSLTSLNRPPSIWIYLIIIFTVHVDPFWGLASWWLTIRHGKSVNHRKSINPCKSLQFHYVNRSFSHISTDPQATTSLRPHLSELPQRDGSRTSESRRQGRSPRASRRDRCRSWFYRLLKMAIEMVDLPIENCEFP